MLPAPPYARGEDPAPLRRHRCSPAVTLYFCGLGSRGESVPGAVRPRYTSPSVPTSSITPGWEGGDGLAATPGSIQQPQASLPTQLLLGKLRHRSSPRRSLSQPRCPLSESPPSLSLPCWGLEGEAPWAAWGRCWCVCPHSTSVICGSSPRVCGTGHRDAQCPAPWHPVLQPPMPRRASGGAPPPPAAAGDPCPPSPAGSTVPPQPQELPMAVTSPGALCRGHREAGAGLSHLQGLILGTPFTGGTMSPPNLGSGLT